MKNPCSGTGRCTGGLGSGTTAPAKARQMKPRRGCGVNATHNIGRQIGQAVAAYLKARDAALPWPVRAVDARFWILCCGGLARDGRAAFGCNHLIAHSATRRGSGQIQKSSRTHLGNCYYAAAIGSPKGVVACFRLSRFLIEETRMNHRFHLRPLLFDGRHRAERIRTPQNRT